MRILLVRHGESLGNVDPLIHATTADHAVPLSDRGREQAREAGARVAEYLEAQTLGERPHVRLWVSVICHGVTLRAFVMMWCHLSPEWFEAEANPNNCAIRLIESGVDKGHVFGGFPHS